MFHVLLHHTYPCTCNLLKFIQLDAAGLSLASMNEPIQWVPWWISNIRTYSMNTVMNIQYNATLPWMEKVQLGRRVLYPMACGCEVQNGFVATSLWDEHHLSTCQDSSWLATWVSCNILLVWLLQVREPLWVLLGNSTATECTIASCQSSIRVPPQYPQRYSDLQ